MNKTPLPPSDDQEELVHADDAVIGRAVRWSVVVLLLILAGGAGLCSCSSTNKWWPRPQMTRMAAPVLPVRPQSEVPTARFTDITKAAGIQFVHNNGAYGEKLLPETMGGGVAFLDFDNDGKQDLLFVNSAHWPWQTRERGACRQRRCFITTTAKAISPMSRWVRPGRQLLWHGRGDWGL